MSSKLQTTVTTDITLDPTQQLQLDTAIATYTELKVMLDDIQRQIDQEKDVMRLVLEDAGVGSVKAGGVSLAIVKGTTSTLDKAKLKAQGVTDAMLLAATTVRSKKPYLMVRSAGEEVA